MVVFAALVGLWHLGRPAFLPPAGQSARRAVPVAGAVAALTGAMPALADKIDDAAVKLSEASYPFLKEYPWNDAGYTVTLPGASPSAVLKAIKPTLEMGAAMDPSALKAGVLAHAQAIGSVDGNGVTSLADYTAINKALGHMIASAGEAKTMAVYNAWKGLVPAEVPAFLMSKVNAADAKAAYAALMEFKDVVKASR